jgi:hypothetical protein
MGIHIDMVRARGQVPAEHVSKRIASLGRPAKAPSLATRRGLRPHAPMAAAQAKALAVADIRSLERIGWTFIVATLIVWAIATVLVLGTAP